MLGRITAFLVNVHLSRGSTIRPSDVFPPRNDDEDDDTGGAVQVDTEDLDPDGAEEDLSVLERTRLRRQREEAQAFWNSPEGRRVKTLLRVEPEEDE